MNGKQAKRCRRLARKMAEAPAMKRDGRHATRSPRWWYKRLKRGVSRGVIAPLPEDRAIIRVAESCQEKNYKPDKLL
jgi:hypothetical protein